MEARLAVSLLCSGCLRCWVSPAGGILRGQGGACAPISGNHICSLLCPLILPFYQKGDEGIIGLMMENITGQAARDRAKQDSRIVGYADGFVSPYLGLAMDAFSLVNLAL